VFCIHGNKFGVARCCDDLWPTSDPAIEGETTDDKAPLVENEVTGRMTQRQRSQDGGEVIS
jgi:hypothetical protein